MGESETSNEQIARGVDSSHKGVIFFTQNIEFDFSADLHLSWPSKSIYTKIREEDGCAYVSGFVKDFSNCWTDLYSENYVRCVFTPIKAD